MEERWTCYVRVGMGIGEIQDEVLIFSSSSSSRPKRTVRERLEKAS